MRVRIQECYGYLAKVPNNRTAIDSRRRTCICAYIQAKTIIIIITVHF
jgi:hypothetical protein